MYTLQRDNVIRIADSESKRDTLISKGFVIVDEPIEKKTLDNITELDKMTVNDLKAYATNKAIDITGLTKKEDILKRIKETEQD